MKRINRKIALHRFGEIKDVADMAYSILTNRYMNGSIVDIHGGYDYFLSYCSHAAIPRGFWAGRDDRKQIRSSHFV